MVKERISHHGKHTLLYSCVSSVFTEALPGNGLHNPTVSAAAV
jgi:hypothetical protein